MKHAHCFISMNKKTKASWCVYNSVFHITENIPEGRELPSIFTRHRNEPNPLLTILHTSDTWENVLTRLPSDFRYFNLGFPSLPTNFQRRVLEDAVTLQPDHWPSTFVSRSQDSWLFSGVFLEAIPTMMAPSASPCLTLPGRNCELHASLTLNQDRIPSTHVLLSWIPEPS